MNTIDLIETLADTSDAGGHNTEAVDTTTSAGRMVMQMLGSFAEFEPSMVRERTWAGLAAARDRGAWLGRPPN
jgi:DNA invertase Pin-like site-specific DNA recombinase